MRTIIFACSERQDNLSIKAAKAISNYFPEAEILDLRDYHLNLIGSADEETKKNTSALVAKAKEAQQIIIVSPEYNWSLSPNAKNLLDHLSLSGDNEVWNGKIFMCFGCSAGRGGRLPIIELWKILNKLITFAGGISVVSPYHLEITRDLLEGEGEFIASFRETADRIFSHHQRLAETFLKGLN